MPAPSTHTRLQRRIAVLGSELTSCAWWYRLLPRDQPLGIAKAQLTLLQVIPEAGDNWKLGGSLFTNMAPARYGILPLAELNSVFGSYPSPKRKESSQLAEPPKPAAKKKRENRYKNALIFPVLGAVPSTPHRFSLSLST